MQLNIIDIKREIIGTYPDWLDDVKTHLAITGTGNDTELTDLIKQCIAAIEDYCYISIINKRITLTADITEEWELPYGPVIGLESVKARSGNDGSGIPTYLTEDSGWIVEGDDFLSFNPINLGNFNPSTPFTGYFDDDPRSLSKRYKLIYTTGMSYIPENLKLAILNEITYRFENKGDLNLRISNQLFNSMGVGVFESTRVLSAPFKRTAWT